MIYETTSLIIQINILRVINKYATRLLKTLHFFCSLKNYKIVQIILTVDIKT